MADAPPVRLKQYTYKQVLDLVNSLVGNDYNEVLTLTREEKDKQREEEKEREEAKASQIVGTGQHRKKRKVQKKNITESCENMSQNILIWHFILR